MVDIFEEVDEELRKDKYQDLVRQYGPYVVGGAVAIVLGTAGYQGWNAWTDASRERASDAYIIAMNQAEAGRVAEAAMALDALIETGAAGYSTLALLQRAALALDAGDTEAAAGFFDRAANSTGDPLIRDLARLKAVWARWGMLSFNDVEIRLTPLTGPTAPFRHLARESIAVAALQAGDFQRAEREYQFLSTNLDAPQGVVQRAFEGLARLAQQPEPAESIIESEPEVPAPAQPEVTDSEQASAGDPGDD